MTVKNLKQNCWLVDSAAEIHICNNKKLIIDFTKNLTKVGESTTSDGISLSRRNVKIRLALKDKIERLVLTLTNVFYLLNSPSNLGNLGLLNNTGIYYYNKDYTLYKLKT